MKRRLRSGFTLIEVVIALAILAFALFGAISVISYTSRMNMATRERMLAVRAAERKIEQMLSFSDKLEDIWLTFQDQSDGLGWEAVDGLEPVDPAPLDPPDYAPAGYKYPTWPPPKTGPPPRRPVVFVRFPVVSVGGALYFQEVGSGKFANSYQVDPTTHKQLKDAAGNPRWIDLDFDQSNTNLEKFPVSDVLKIKQLPVSVQVYWRGSVGPARGNVGNTYLTYNYTFLRKP